MSMTLLKQSHATRRREQLYNIIASRGILGMHRSVAIAAYNGNVGDKELIIEWLDELVEDRRITPYRSYDGSGNDRGIVYVANRRA